MTRLAGRRALVTGAASGIGLSTASALAREGAVVALLDINEQRLDAAVRDVTATGVDAIGIGVDVADESDVAGAVDHARSRWGGLDIVVANAGVQMVGKDARAHELKLEDWQRTIDINLTGAFLTCKHGIRALLASGGGTVVLTGSPTGFFGRARGFNAYSASKAGVHGLTRVLANDYARDGIRVNAVVPGITETDLIRDIIPVEERDARAHTVPLGRLGTAAEVASVIVFLASDEARYVTGAFYFVDGGLAAV